MGGDKELNSLCPNSDSVDGLSLSSTQSSKVIEAVGRIANIALRLHDYYEEAAKQPTDALDRLLIRLTLELEREFVVATSLGVALHHPYRVHCSNGSNYLVCLSELSIECRKVS